MPIVDGKTILDPRQSLALAGYTNPKSDTFGDLKNSLIVAGFDDQYADSIHGRNPKWLTDNLKTTVDMVKRAEKNLVKYNTIEVKLNSKLNVDIAKLQVDVSKFILKTLARQKYSEEKEQFEPNVQINVVNYNQTLTDDVKSIKEVESL